jgi:energy-coupling factor transporter transmembrane protein EcfT
MKNGIYLIYSVSIVAGLLYIGNKWGTSNMFIIIGSILGFYFITQIVLYLNNKLGGTDKSNTIDDIFVDKSKKESPKSKMKNIDIED